MQATALLDSDGWVFRRHHVKSNPARFADPWGLLVDAELNTATNTINFTDRDTGETVTAEAFTGGQAGSDGSLNFPSEGKYRPAPPGTYDIVDNPNPVEGRMDWYGLFKQDDRPDDYFLDEEQLRDGVRLHRGQTSFGCVTVNQHQADARAKWRAIRALLAKTKKGEMEFRAGPHWWNSTSTTTVYGSLTIK